MNQFLKSICLIFAVLTAISAAGQNSPLHINHQASISIGLQSPLRIAIGTDGYLYVTEPDNKKVMVYTPQGLLHNTYQLSIKAIAVAVNSQNQVYIGDGQTGIIYRLGENGSLTQFFEGVQQPTDMVFDEADNLYVVDKEYRRIVVLDSEGSHINDFGNGTFTYPVGIAYDKKNKRLLVSEHGGIGSGFKLPVKVWFCELDGTINGSFGKSGNSDGEFTRIQGLAVSDKGLIYVVDPYQSVVSIFDESGSFVSRFGSYGENNGSLNVPIDIVLNKYNRAYITSLNTGNVEVFYANETLPTAEFITQEGVICGGASEKIEIDFTGTSPWTFTYTIDGENPVTLENITEDPESNTFFLEVTTPGLYEVTELIDANFYGTKFIGSANIAENVLPTALITSSDVVICPGESTAMDIAFTGTGPWTYTYAIDGIEHFTETTEQPSRQLSVNEFGAYTITQLSDAGQCVGTISGAPFTVSDNGLPSALIQSEDVILCNGASFTIEVNLSGVGPWDFEYTDGLQTYQVTTSDNPHLLSVNTSGSYEILSISDVVQSGTCTEGIVNIIVEPLVSSNIVPETINICEGEEGVVEIDLTGTAPWSLTYTIDGLNPVTITDIYSNPYQLKVAQAGVVELTELCSVYCAAQTLNGSKTIVVHALPDATFTLGRKQVFICPGETTDLEVSLLGQGPWSFIYHIDDRDTITSSIATTSLYDLNTSKAGIYEIIKVTDVHCTNDGKFASYPEIVHSSPSANIISSDATICEGNSTQIQLELKGIAPWQFTYTRDGANAISIDTDNPNYIIEATEPGLYEIADVSDPSGAGICINGAAQIDVVDKPIAAFDHSANILELSFFNNSSNATSYEWDFGDGNTSNEVDPVHTYSNSGTYNVQLTASSADCGSITYSEQVQVLVTSIEDQIIKYGFAIYPNPSDGEFTIRVSEGDKSVYTLEVINMFGELIITKQIEGNGINKLDMKAYSSGVYNIRLSDGTTSYTSKVVISK
ncbi:PKD domain-containing protein [Carboxylicivirga marina]|uniref:T9SS type A sorting domain-containing protein n=1 Tax=Carboxylicivirga marina TaxID=2800988 RepID=A0ABS1HE23_9BACT|nr:PKD domain-containing protein [Carboxylicivirga marina]MBK3515876.1 T9SS type A sorting domain-containing protein [Carboxylicivirga marina]